ncbi:MAG TPA: bifunctional tetrahydrofolate synthase/dihydrofolate synthase [Rhodanobacteraceae bacterium]|nr:bifunctional tetrahydrofolate synthase/dihydrofolate synthase [Rhodanobacteraceae bacterium]
MQQPSNLAEWLDYQQRVHPREVELGLARVQEAWLRLGALPPAPVVITVGGTNGKGSTIAFLEAMLSADGKRVGAYTSPHLLRYNERVRVAGHEVADAVLEAAFARIETARREIALTYFEFATLAALVIFADSGLDVALLEVGLGGRLDAVNIVDADAAIVTTVDFDHQEYLGNDRDGIGREKAGIFRRGRPGIIGEIAPVRGLVDEARRIGADLRMAGRDFHVQVEPRGWHWRRGAIDLALPEPGLIAPCQHANAAAAIAALDALAARLGWNPAAIAQGVASARIGARLQRFSGRGEWVVDVAHNPQAARVLAQWLRAHRPAGRSIAVFGALADKDVRGIVEALYGCFDSWHLAGLAGESARGLDAATLRVPVEAALGGLRQSVHEDLAGALDAAFELARNGDRVVAFGSFFVAAAALRFARERTALVHR